MSTRNAIVAVFVKTPGRSALKTRLAESLGASTAESLYLDAVDCVREAIDATALTRCWAVAEPEACGDQRWSDAPCTPQPAGDLGLRMAGVFRALRSDHPAVLLVGGDLPQLDAGLLDRAADWLRMPDRHVIGPARDGGFWLYGSSAENPTAGWPGLPYSQPGTARCFRNAIGGPEANWLELPERTDLDEGDDLVDVRRELAALDAPTPAQQRLLGRLDTLLERLSARRLR